MLSKIKTVLYWATLIGPAFDVVLGAYRGVKEVVMRFADTRQYLSELDQFHKDNQDITFKSMLQDIDLNEKRKKGVKK